MAQMHEHPCPNCGTLVAADQRFCTNCGTAMESVQPSSQPSSQYYGYGRAPQNYQQPPQVNPQLPSYAQLTPDQQQKQNPIGDALGALGLLFLLRRSQRRYGASGARSGCCALLVVLVMIGFIAVIIYVVLHAHGY